MRIQETRPALAIIAAREAIDRKISKVSQTIQSVASRVLHAVGEFFRSIKNKICELFAKKVSKTPAGPVEKMPNPNVAPKATLPKQADTPSPAEELKTATKAPAEELETAKKAPAEDSTSLQQGAGTGSAPILAINSRFHAVINNLPQQVRAKWEKLSPEQQAKIQEKSENNIKYSVSRAINSSKVTG